VSPRPGQEPGEQTRTTQVPPNGRPETAPPVLLVGQHAAEEDLAAVLAVLAAGHQDPWPPDGASRSGPGTATAGWTDRYRTLRNTRGLLTPGPGRWRDPCRPG
jgi:hypothetical protein